MSGLEVRPISQREAKAYVLAHHRHLKPPAGAKFVVAVQDLEGQIRGVAFAGRPVARMLDDGLTVEVTRVCTDGARNACSMLYGACARAAAGMGYRRAITYTLPEEGGASLRASGFVDVGRTGGGEWSRPSRVRGAAEQPAAKTRWERKL